MKITKRMVLLWLSYASVSPLKQRDLLKQYDLIELFERMNSFSAPLKQFLPSEIFERLQNTNNEQFLMGIEEELKELGISTVTIFEDEYPALLREDGIEASPVLYYKGDISLASTPCLAVVGTRKFTEYGKACTKAFVRKLVKHFTIVSGLAFGIDAVAHEATLTYGGKTIAVIPCGLANIYPKSNDYLAREIEQKGLLISEYFPRREPERYMYPERNRIISGLSKGVLVTEAPERSGALYTAEFAVDQSREVFAVMANINAENSKGTNNLIVRGVAHPVAHSDDVLRVFNLLGQKTGDKLSIQLDNSETIVYDLLVAKELSFDEIVECAGINASELNRILVKMELEGIIYKQSGKYYILKE